MPRTITLAARQALYAQETDIGFPVLLTLSHSTFSQPLRFTNWDTNLQSRGETYIRFPFDITLPQDSIDAPPSASLSIDNVDRTIIQTLRQVTTRISVTLEIVTTNDLNTVEASFDGFELKDVSYNQFTVSGSLIPETFLREPYPSRRFTPGAFRGIF